MDATTLVKHRKQVAGELLTDDMWEGIWKMSDGSYMDIVPGSGHGVEPEHRDALDTVFFSTPWPTPAGITGYWNGEEAADYYEYSVWEDVCRYCEQMFGCRPVSMVAEEGTARYRQIIDEVCRNGADWLKELE